MNRLLRIGPGPRGWLTPHLRTLTISWSECNTFLKTVTRSSHSWVARTHASSSRAVSLLLLVFIIYGTTIEAAHRHGRVLNAPNVSASTSVSNAGDSKGLAGGLLGCSDCLICQLHQNFSATLITFRQISAPPAFRAHFSNTTVPIVLAQSNTPIKGRAPPLNCL